jgi:hypothetical protein
MPDPRLFAECLGWTKGLRRLRLPALLVATDDPVRRGERPTHCARLPGGRPQLMLHAANVQFCSGITAEDWRLGRNPAGLVLVSISTGNAHALAATSGRHFPKSHSRVRVVFDHRGSSSGVVVVVVCVVVVFVVVVLQQATSPRRQEKVSPPLKLLLLLLKKWPLLLSCVSQAMASDCWQGYCSAWLLLSLAGLLLSLLWQTRSSGSKVNQKRQGALLLPAPARALRDFAAVGTQTGRLPLKLRTLASCS